MVIDACSNSLGIRFLLMVLQSFLLTISSYLLKKIGENVDVFLEVAVRYSVVFGGFAMISIFNCRNLNPTGNYLKLICRGWTEVMYTMASFYGFQMIAVGKKVYIFKAIEIEFSHFTIVNVFCFFCHIWPKRNLEQFVRNPNGLSTEPTGSL